MDICSLRAEGYDIQFRIEGLEDTAFIAAMTNA